MILNDRIKAFMENVDDLKVTQEANIKNKKELTTKVESLRDSIMMTDADLALYKDAIEVLRQVSDQSVRESYTFIKDAVNRSLARIFEQERRIELNEYSLGVYPQLEIELYVENGKKRSLKTNSGRGIAQIISFLCLLSIIVIVKARRFVVLDEALGGLSGTSRMIISEIMWNFTQIGFQFVMNEHGFVPKGAKVYYLKNIAGESSIAEEFIEHDGIYLSMVGDSDLRDAEYIEMIERNKGRD